AGERARFSLAGEGISAAAEEGHVGGDLLEGTILQRVFVVDVVLACLDSNRVLGALPSLPSRLHEFDVYPKQNCSFQQVTAYMPFFGSGGYSLTGKGEPRALTGVMVDSNFFQTLGVKPLYGRAFLPGETAKGAAHVAILDNAFWRQHFNSDLSVLNTVVTINRRPYTVVGILPPSFDFGAAFAPGQRIELFEPYPWDDIRQW